MKRRGFLAILSGAAFARESRAAQPDWQGSLVTGAFNGQHYRAGLYIAMSPGWKTYWRVPGEAGIPPQVKVSGDNVESCEVLLPLPERITDSSGESLGYHHDVMFLLVLKPKALGQDVSARVSTSFGVCGDICMPAKFDGMLELKSKSPDADSVLDEWWRKLPASVDFVNSATQVGDELLLTLKQSVDDIFVEGPGGPYFRKPGFIANKAVIRIDGLTQGQKLQGHRLRLTATRLAKGLEQVVIVA